MIYGVVWVTKCWMAGLSARTETYHYLKAHLIKEGKKNPDFLVALREKPNLQRTIDADCFHARAFVTIEASKIHERLIAFPFTTWGQIFVLCAFFGLMFSAACMDAFWFYIAVVALHFVTTGYLTIRYLHVWRVFRLNCLDGGERHPWPLTLIDQIISPMVGPGAAGFWPWTTWFR